MAITRTTVTNHLVLKEDLTQADSAGANVVTTNSTSFTDQIGEQTVIVLLTVIEECAGDGGVDAKIQGSLDGTNFADLATISLDLDTTAADNVATGTTDLAAVQMPYYRVALVTDGTDTQDAATIRVQLAFQP